MAVVFSVVATVPQYPGAADPAASAQPAYNSVFVAPYTFVFYLLKLLFPFNLSCVYPSHPSITNELTAVFYLSPFLLVLTTLLIIFAAWQNRTILLGFSFYLITLLPVSQVIPQATPAIVADRYSYIPAIGIFLIVSLGLARLFKGRAGTSFKSFNHFDFKCFCFTNPGSLLCLA